MAVRFQGHKAYGLRKLISLTARLILQGLSQKVAQVIRGRMLGASVMVPAAIHVYDESESTIFNDSDFDPLTR